MSRRRTRFTTNIIIDLDSVTCPSEPEEAISFSETGTIFKVCKDNPFLELLRARRDVGLLKDEGDVLYFVKL